MRDEHTHVIVYSRKVMLDDVECWTAYTKTPPLVRALALTEQRALDLVHAKLEDLLGMEGEYLGTVHG